MSDYHRGNREFGRLLQERRLSLGVTEDGDSVPAHVPGDNYRMRQLDLADLCQVGEKAVQQWEAGCRLPNRDALLRMWDVVHLDAAGFAELGAPLREALAQP